MLPGYVSGFYSYDDCHIDLAVLATYSNARLIHAEATGIDIAAKQVTFPSRPPISYDVLSIDIGISPARSNIPGATDFTVPVKPIDKFVARLDEALQRFRQGALGPGARRLRFAVVGGGAGGVELAMALHFRLQREHDALGRPEELRPQVRRLRHRRRLLHRCATSKGVFIIPMQWDTVNAGA